ncbi:MAG TPA: helix-turn-helix transcriptional regulator [Chitinophagaceae bacterium]|nr:helix-turn-helix transcriptional regulator [Chitinophagaceae bacterium]
MFNYYEKVKSRPEVFNQLACKELLFVHYKCPMTARMWDAKTQYNYLQFLLSGKKRYHTPGRSWLFKSGDAFFVKKGACVIEKYFEEPLTILTFFIPDSYLQDFIRENSSLKNSSGLSKQNNDLIIPLHLNEIMGGFIESVIPYFYSENRPSESLLDLKFQEALMTILTDPHNLDFKTYLQQLNHPQYDPFQQIMEANCLYNLALEDYAKMLNLSLSSFKRQFVSGYKTSPGKWLQTQKLNNAYKLLLHTDKQITDISFESGFENSTHFSHLFKKRFGASPLNYRKEKSSSKNS